jgi:hypothetical protein
MRRALAIFLAVIALSAQGGCGPREPVSPDQAEGGTHRLAVLPFRVEGSLDPNGRFLPAADADVSEEVGLHVAERLTDELARLGQAPVPSPKVLRATPVAGAAVYDPRLAARVARDLGAEFAVMGAVRRYVQRVGSALSVESPATVEYQAMAVDAGSGAVIGSYLFDYTQQPLAADLTQLPDFVQGGGKWRTREDILDRSLAKTAEKIASAMRGRRATAAR